MLIALAPVSVAQSLRVVEGRVVNEDGVPIEGASISVKNLDQTYKSDAYGNFSIKIPYGCNYISATYTDHITATAEIDGSYMILKLKYDVDGVKLREEARLRAQQDSINAANAIAVAALAAAAKAEKERIATEEQARKDAEAKAKAEAKAEKRAAAKAKDDAYNEKFKNKGLVSSIDFSYVYELSSSDVLVYKYSGYRTYGNLSPMQLTYTLSYKFNRWISLGIGAGALFNAKSITIVNDSFASPNENFKEQRLDIPIFMDIKVNFLRTRVRPYISLSGGYYFLSKTPMGEGGIGCEIRFSKNYSFHIQASASLTPWPWFRNNYPAEYTAIINPGISVGFDF